MKEYTEEEKRFKEQICKEMSREELEDRCVELNTLYNNIKEIQFTDELGWNPFLGTNGILDAPKKSDLILVTNGGFVEICYYEDGELKTPWRYDDDDTPTFNIANILELHWKYLILPIIKNGKNNSTNIRRD